MPFVKIWIHAVWTTKKRRKILEKSRRQEIFSHIHQNALSKEILMEVVNGHCEHIHCLFRLKKDQTISNAINKRGSIILGKSAKYFETKIAMAGLPTIGQFGPQAGRVFCRFSERIPSSGRT